MKLKNMNVVTCPPCGESTLKGGKGVVNKDTLMDTPPSALRATSPAGGEVNGGFTLIELLVVVLIIGILAAVAVPQYQIAVTKSRVATMLPLLKNLDIAKETYYLANGSYPRTTSVFDITAQGNCTHLDFAYYDNEGKGELLTCGKYFLLNNQEDVIDLYHCPDKNITDFTTCWNNVDFFIRFWQKHSASPDAKDCYVVNNSKLGKAVCSSLAGFEPKEM